MRTHWRTAVFLSLMLGLALGATIAVAQELPPGGTFWDDNGNTHEGFIEAIKEAGITTGCSSDGFQYCPDDNVTREQMATFLARALELDPLTAGPFLDVAGVHAPNINAIAAAGISLGCNADGTLFCPLDPVRRDQMASFMARALDGLDPATQDYFGDDDGNIHEDNINIVAENGITVGCDASGNYCPDNLVARDQMASFLGRALDLTEVVVPPASDPQLQLVASGLGGAVLITAPDGDPRLFIVEKSGQITIVEDGSVVGTPFLDIGTLVSKGGEQGLLGMAFDPNYDANGLFYVSYTNTSGDSRVVRYEVSGADPNIADPTSAYPIIGVGQDFGNHNGGHIAFGPDGHLWFGLGDGGGGGDPNNRAEDLNSLLGKMLRLDVSVDDFPTDDARNYGIPDDNPLADEIWAYGLRNPWRWSFDHETGYLYIADVGQNAWEEVSVVDSTVSNINFGWDILEGTHCHEPSSGCSSAGTVLPVLEYGHSVGTSITGGYVYRGTAMPDLVGTYFYGDAGAGWVKSFRFVDGAAVQQRDWPDLAPGGVWGFGEDSSGEMYVGTQTSVYKFVP